MTSNHRSHSTRREPLSHKLAGARRGWILFLGCLTVLAACGCASSKSSQAVGLLAGNWQFTMTVPSDASFTGGTNCATPPCPVLLGGFLLQNSVSVTGALTYSIMAPPTQTPCSGSAPVTGSLQGQNVSFTVQAGPQSFNLMGTVSADGKTMMGTYSSTNTQGCGTMHSGMQWSAASVPVVSGPFQGFFHSGAVHNQFNAGFPVDEDLPVSGVLTQGPNLGASNATVTGTLSFPQGYPCLGSSASVNGQVSGSSIVLQIIASNGLIVGQIGSSTTSPLFQASPVSVQSTTNGLILIGANGYSVSSKNCPGVVGISAGDFGNICLALGVSTACTQPILISPASLTFPPQPLGSTTSQTITLTNNDPTGAPLTNLTLAFSSESGDSSFNIPSDFSGLANFSEQNNCTPTLATTFTLLAGQSCSILVSFSPQESCPWLPSIVSGETNPTTAGAPPTSCPLPLTGKLKVILSSPTNTDSDANFAVPLIGTGLSAITPIPVELDFGSEATSESSPAQSITFTNQGVSPVQILPPSNTACGAPGQAFTLPRPPTPGTVSGLQVVANGNLYPPITAVQGPPSTVTYACDVDPQSRQPNFPISNDSCSGTILAPQQSCTIQISFAPQPATAASLAAGVSLDFFLELNTLQCTSGTTTNCEIDSGRFPVELKANSPSPLRMTPGAGLEFGTLPVGQTSAPLTITLFNDPKDPNAGTVNFIGNRVKGDYFEADNCGASLAPGNSCTLTISFKPQSAGFDPGNILIGYTLGNTAQFPQTIYLRGTGK